MFIGVGIATATNCPHCIYFHTEEARLSGVTDEELRETVSLIADAKYSPTALHGNETGLDGLKAETGEVVEYITK